MSSSRWIVVAALLIATAPEALAQDPRLPPPQDKPWTYDISFYFWLPQMDGDIESHGLKADINADYSDVLDHLESTFAVRFEAWMRDSWGVAFDINWLNLDGEPDFPAGQGKVEANFGFTELMLFGRTRSGNAYLDAYGGVRWVRTETGLEEPGGRDEEDSNNYFDPVLGIRIGYQASNWAHGSLRFDVGGFGIGTEHTGNLVVQVDFRVGESTQIGVGWRTMALEIDDHRQEIDLLLSGPILAVKVAF